MNQSLNILMITSRADFGGGPEHVYRLIRYLGGRVKVFAACPDDYPYYQRYSELIGKQNILKIPHRRFNLSSLSSLIKFTKQNNISVIHSHGKGAGIYSRPIALLTGRKCVHTFHGIHTGRYGSIKKILYLLIEKMFSLLTDRFISVSASEAETVLDYGITRKTKLAVIHNGTYMPYEKVSYPEAGTLNIITITRFDFAKNTQLLIPVAEELLKIIKRDFRFIILGAGEDESQFRKILLSKGLEKYFDLKGFVESTGDYLKDSFCYISTSRWEGLPLGVLEAMSCGLPVVATDVNGNRDLVIHGVTGFLYGIENPSDAAKYILELAAHKDKYERFSAEARKLTGQKFSLQKMADDTLNLYLNLK